MPSPRRLFRNATQAQLDALLASALERALSGEFTSLSGAAKSSSKAWMDLQDQIFEINAELDRRNGVGRASRVVNVLLHDDVHPRHGAVYGS